VIIWPASYPRSGNTFLRLVLYRLYGARSSTVYDVDGVAERLGADLVGFDERPSSINAMRAADAVYFMKTHRQRDSQVDESDPAICLVRDGRDAMVSYAHLTSEGDATQFAPMLRSLICRHDEVGTGNWGRNVLSWLLPPADHLLVLRYEDLVCDPEGAVNHLMAKLLSCIAEGCESDVGCE
jgi:Sulfotransferase domain